MHRLRTLVATLACLAISPALAMVGGAPPAPESLTRSVVMVVGSYGTLCTPLQSHATFCSPRRIARSRARNTSSPTLKTGAQWC